MKIAYLDPVPESARLDVIGEELKKYAEPGTEVDYLCLDRGTDNFEYLAFEAVMTPLILAKVKELEGKYDAVIIGCFFDPGLDALREFAGDIVVAGPGESSVSLAGELGKSFSIIAPRRKLIPRMRQTAMEAGGGERLASIRTLDIKVVELQNDPQLLLDRLKEEIRLALEEDLAEVIVLGCTLEVGQFRSLQEEFGVPVIDPVVAALKNAEHLVRCKQTCSWTVSRALSYEPPNAEEVERVHLFDAL